MLTAVTILALPAAATLGYAPAVAASGIAPELQGFTFTPELTPIGFTVTPEATAINTIDPGPSPTADEPSEEDEEVELELGGGDWQVGYDFVETEDGGQWHIWMNGEVIIVSADDLELITLLAAFREQAVIRAQAKRDIEAAYESRADAIVGTFEGAVAGIGGILLGAPSCAATPLTFWAAGGTGWGCVAGLLAAGGGGALLGSSINGILRANTDLSEADERLEDSSREAEELFGSIRDEVASNP